MLKPKKYFIAFGILFILCLIVGLLFYYWLKLPYGYSPQRNVAEKFVQLIFDNELEKAYEMTLRTHYTGMDFDEFKQRAKQEIIWGDKSYKVLYVYPKQSNGNRLRRLIKGKPVDELRVSIEFSTGDLFRVEVCDVGNQQWKVCRFNGHAG